MDAIFALLGTHWEFIGTIFLGATVKILLSETLSWRGAGLSAAMAIFAATFFTTPTINLIGYFASADMSEYVLQVAALWTIIGEGVVRALVKASQDENAIAGMFMAAFKRAFKIGGN